MNHYKPQLINLLKQLGFVFLLYSFCRLLFYMFNKSYFQEISFTEFNALLFYGLRFDAFSIAATNALYILLCALPFQFYYSKGYQKITSIIFIITNTAALSLNFIDFAYFPFTQKRTTCEVANLIFGGQTEFTKLIPHFLADFWYMVLLFIGFVWLLITIHFKIKKQEIQKTMPFSLKLSGVYVLIFLLLIGSTVLGIRGGLQRVPIVLVDAATYTEPRYIPIVINTPFSILKSAELTELTPINLFSDEQLKTYYNPIQNADTGTFKPLNVCVIILESFSKEFTGIGNRKSFTPFLDSLMKQSLLFKNGIANGKTSINGIPAVIASMPCLLENQYLNSMYSNNRLQTLPNLLKEKGYYSVFFHGGTNGTMNFNSFAKLAGYDAYYGRNEYNNDEDYDGQWGIWDEPFLQKTVEEMSKLKSPFFTSIFTLSSHNPFTIPNKYKGKFPKGPYDITESIGYADYALKQFFNEARKQTWFNNTLFVITPDHTSTSSDPFYSNLNGQYSIPILFYKSDLTPKKEEKTVQQIDILPTVLDFLNYDKPFYSLGKSMLNENRQPCMYYNSPYFCCVKDSFFYVIKNHQFIDKYNHKKDRLLKTNLVNTNEDKQLLNIFNAYNQTYTNDLINNKTYYDNKK